MVMDPNTKAYTTYMLTPTGWIKNGESVPTTDKIPVNKGFFYQKAFKEGSITFTRPY